MSKTESGRPSIWPHPSHKTRFSDSSFYDEICENCGATDTYPSDLARTCPRGKNK